MQPISNNLALDVHTWKIITPFSANQWQKIERFLGVLRKKFAQDDFGLPLVFPRGHGVNAKGRVCFLPAGKLRHQATPFQLTNSRGEFASPTVGQPHDEVVVALLSWLGKEFPHHVSIELAGDRLYQFVGKSMAGLANEKMYGS